MAKSNPIGARFDLDKLELIMRERNLTSPQGVLNYLMDHYVPKVVPIVKTEQIIAGTQKGQELKPPPGLTGPDLTIWKMEQKNKQSL